MPIYETPDYTSDYLLIPARSESIHYVAVESGLKGDVVVWAKELGKELFIGSMIVNVKDGKVPIKILNTGENNIRLPRFMPKIQSFNEI